MEEFLGKEFSVYLQDFPRNELIRNIFVLKLRSQILHCIKINSSPICFRMFKKKNDKKSPSASSRKESKKDQKKSREDLADAG